MNILVTGADGQLGRCLKDVREHDKLAMKEGVWFFANRHDIDIADKDCVTRYIENHEIDIIINCAAYTDVEKSETDVNAFRANSLGPLYLAQALKPRGGILIHISTDYVYRPFEGWNGAPFKEDDDCGTKGLLPLNSYGMSKLMGEMNVKDNKGNYLIIRTSWLYSAYGKNFLKTVREKLLNAGIDDTFRFVCDQVGTPTSAHNLASFIYSSVNKYSLRSTSILDLSMFESDVINYSDDGVCSWYDFAMEINDCLNKPNTIAPCYSHEYQTNVKRPAYSVMSKEKIKTDERYLPYVNTVHWKQGVRNVMKRLEI